MGDELGLFYTSHLFSFVRYFKLELQYLIRQLVKLALNVSTQ